MLLDLCPSLVCVALENGFAKDDLSMAILKGGEGGGCRDVTGVDVVVEGSETHFECVRETFGVSTWVGSECGGFCACDRWVFDKRFVRFISVA